MLTPEAKKYSAACTSFTESLQFENIPAPALDMIKCCLLDWLGCVIRGHLRKHSDPAKAYVRTMGGTTQASMVGEKKAGTIINAAFFNGYLGHILEMDDVDRDSISHPATVVIPAALAVGEWKEKTGKDLITAIVAGYEVMLRIGAAMTPRHYEIWHTTGTAGAFGAAMAAGKLFDLKRPELDWALGNVGTMSAGLWQFLLDGGMSKFLHTGRAAENGVMAAYLATQGFTGPTRILEGAQGFFAGYARQEISPKVFADFGSNWRSAFVSIKPYPCCRHIHSSIDAANAIREKTKGKKIKGVQVKTYAAAVQVADILDPKTPQEAKFSLRFCIARTLMNGLVTDREFTNETLHDATTRDLMQKIDVKIDPALDAMMPHNWPSHIEAYLEDGAAVKAEVHSPTGDPDNPVDWKGIIFKFSQMSEGVLNDKGVKAVADACERVEDLRSTADLVQLINKHGRFPA